MRVWQVGEVSLMPKSILISTLATLKVPLAKRGCPTCPPLSFLTVRTSGLAESDRPTSSSLV